ncbi:hypothetical protein DPSP01_001589 [Paraphaeosphaeria sporulosa]
MICAYFIHDWLCMISHNANLALITAYRYQFECFWSMFISLQCQFLPSTIHHNNTIKQVILSLATLPPPSPISNTWLLLIVGRPFQAYNLGSQAAMRDQD